MGINYWAVDLIKLPQKLYDKLTETIKENFDYYTYTVEELVEEILLSFVNRNNRRFIVYKHYITDSKLYDIYYWHFKVIPLKSEDRDNAFVGTYTHMKRKEELLEFAKNNCDVSADEIEFVNQF